MVHMEEMLVTWMEHRKRQGLNITFNDTKKKAMECYHHLKEMETSPVPEFNTSTGWFYKFNNRYAIRSIKRTGETKSTDEDTAASYPDCLSHIIEEGGWGGTSPSRCLTCMKRACSGRRYLNARTSTREEKSAPSFKAFKDRFTLLLGANLMGDFKLKPILAYHAENPCALKDYD